MPMLKLTLLTVIALFPISEIVLAVVKRSRGGGADDPDRGSWRLLWLAIPMGVGLAFIFQGVPVTRFPGPYRPYGALALILLVGGLALRWTAILSLGRLFTVDVAILPDHEIVESGLYRWMRHPSYTGLMLAFLGLGVSFANWLSIVVIFVPIGAAILNRVVKEERALTAAFGPAYTRYCIRTKRFIPGLF